MHENRQITAAKFYVLPAVLSTIMMKKFSSPFFHDDNEAMKSPLSTKSKYEQYMLLFICLRVCASWSSQHTYQEPHSLLGNQPVIKLFSVQRELSSS